MPGKHATGTQGILTSSELDRDVAGVQGTYGWSVQSGAVTFSSGLTFAVAAIAAGDYTVNSVVGAAYAGGTVDLTTQDPTLPRVDIIVITSAGSVSAVAGTPAALTTTSGPKPPTPSASQLEIARIYVPASGTALSSASITDRRHPKVTSGWTLVGSNTTEQTMTSATAADLVTVSGLNIPATAPIMIVIKYRKSASAAQPSIGLKLNTTVVIDAVSTTNSCGTFATTNEAQSGTSTILIGARESTYDYGVSGFWSSGGASGGTSGAIPNAAPTAAMPVVAITDIIIRGDSDGSATLGVKSVKIYQG